jgi:hypothetical protein
MRHFTDAENRVGWVHRCIRPKGAPRRPPPPPTAVTPRSYHLALYVTGYSWGCGATGNTADGSPAQMGDIASTNPALWHHSIVVPSLGYSGYVNDIGGVPGGIDLFAPSCSAALTYTGLRDVVVAQ